MTIITLNSVIQGAVNDIDTGNNSERNNSIAMKYYGFDGLGGTSMQAAGDDYGLTRESVRQITNKVAQKLQDGFQAPESLYEAAKVIEANTPSSAERLESILVEKGLLEKGFMIEGILNIISILDFKGLKLTSDQIVKHNGLRFIVSKESLKLPQKVESAAISEISHNGAASIEGLSKDLKKGSKDVRNSFVSAIVSTMDDVKWANSDGDWFFFENKGRNRLLNRMEQVFSVFKSVPADNLLQAIERSWKKNFKKGKTKLLDKNIMIDVLVSTGKYDISDDVITSKEIYDAEENVKEFERKIFDMIKNSDTGVCREKELEDALVVDKEGKSKWNFSVALNYCPLIIKHKEKRGLYQLTGTPL